MLTELAGVWLIVREIRNAEQVLRSWQGPSSANEVMAILRRRSIQTAHYQQEADEQVIAHLLGSQTNRWTAVALLVTGICLGTLGNFLSLSW